MSRPGLSRAPRRAGVVLAASLSCTAVTGVDFPPGARSIPPTFSPLSVSGLPSNCDGQVYYESSTSLCPPGTTYFLCDGNAYTEYVCSNPGAGWSMETLSQYDRVATDPSACPAGGAGETIYVENNLVSPGDNAVLVYRSCRGTLPSVLVARYATGGSGAADLYDRGILDADQQVVVNEDQTLLFAVNQGSDSIAAFHVGSNGLLSPVAGSPFPSGGPAPGSLGVSGDILVVANKASDGVRDLGSRAPNYTTFRIGSDGSLKPTGFKFELPLRASPTQAFVAPGGRVIFGTEESGVMRGLALSSSGALTLAPASPFALPNSLFPGGRPQPVWPAGLSATSDVLYTGIPNNNSIAAFDYTGTGKLSLIGGFSDNDTHKPSLPCWSVVSADQKRLYFANAGSGNVSVWNIETDPRHPHLLQTFELQGGGNPWGLHIDGSGQTLFVITPRQVRQVPLGQGQWLHGLRILSDGTLDQEIAGSPVPLPVPPGTNVFGLALVSRL